MLNGQLIYRTSLKMIGKSAKIFVSHSGRQYVHHLLFAIQLYKFEYKFYTSFWYKPGRFPFSLLNYFPEKLRSKIEKELRKRYFDKIDGGNVRQFPFFEIIRETLDKILSPRLAEYMLYYRDRIHDAWASAQLNTSYGLVIGYEECALKTFRKAKKMGLVTILDLAQIHYKEIQHISEQFPVFGEIYSNKRLRKKINAIKSEELALSDYIICLSSFAKDSLVKHGITADKIFIVNLGFDPHKFVSKKEYTTSGKLKMVYAGTLTKRKGIDVLLKSLDELKEVTELTIIGPAADAREIVEGQKDKFTWYKYLEQEEMNKIFNNSDIFVFPSYLDSWAMVVLEAMACGLPVIITENTGSKDAVTDSNGFVIPAGDHTQLTEKIRFFIENRNMLEVMGKKSINIGSNYTWNKYYSQINKIIDNIIDAKNVRC